MDETASTIVNIIRWLARPPVGRGADSPAPGALRKVGVRDESRPPAAPEQPSPVPRPREPRQAAPSFAPEVTEAPVPAWAVQFRSPQGLLGAIVASEVLGPPKSLR